MWWKQGLLQEFQLSPHQQDYEHKVVSLLFHSLSRVRAPPTTRGSQNSSAKEMLWLHASNLTDVVMWLLCWTQQIKQMVCWINTDNKNSINYCSTVQVQFLRKRTKIAQTISRLKRCFIYYTNSNCIFSESNSNTQGRVQISIRANDRIQIQRVAEVCLFVCI